MAQGARYYFRIIEAHDGGWACRRGLTELDVHPELDAALEHISDLASRHRPSKIFVHYLDGEVRPVALLD